MPLRPEGTEGWPEAALVALVTRDSIVGVSHPLPASSAASGASSERGGADGGKTAPHAVSGPLPLLQLSDLQATAAACAIVQGGEASRGL